MMIDHITCEARWRSSPGDKELSISDQYDRGRYLRIGEEIKCMSKRGDITLIQYDGKEKHVTSDLHWFRIPPRPEVRMRQQERPDKIALALEHHGQRAATRASNKRVIYPVDDMVVWIESFVIRWKQEPAPGRISLSIWGLGAATPLWKDDDVDGTTGLLDSPAAREALASSQSKPDGQQFFILQLDGPTGRTTVPFSVLPLDNTTALKEELKLWDQEKNDLLRFIGRAYSFDQRNLYWEAAREYEEALKLAPNSCDLLNEALAANERAVDQEQVRQLKEARSKMPRGCPDRISQ
jgi:hypothetical protein